MKECTQCHKLLDESKFSKNKNFKDGLQYCCKYCVSEYKKSDKYKEYEINYRKTPECKKVRSDYEKTDKCKLRRKKYRNLESTKELKRKYFNSEKEKQRRSSQEYKNYHILWQKGDVRKLWLKKYSQTDIYKKILKKYRNSIGGKKRISERMKERYYSDNFFRISCSISSAIKQSLKAKKKGLHWEKIVGYTVEQLVNHLEKQFDDKMSWDNYGSYWHVDHIKPKSLFKFVSDKDKEFIECWSLKNLQPLEAKENLRKSNKYPYICQKPN